MSKDMDSDGDGPLPVIAAITASAAKLGSLETLVRQLPPQSDAAIVVVLQHMEAFDRDRFRKAAQEAGNEPVPIGNGLPIKAGQLYLAEPDTIVTVENGCFVAQPTRQAPGLQGVIDSFLVSLAADVGERAIGVALDGTDGDGTLGARELKATGGLVLAECVSEDLAHSDSAAALAYAVLPVDEIGPRLLSLIEQAARVPAGPVTRPDRPETREVLDAIAALLRQKTGHDFHGYKPSTFLRRVQRRMQALLIDEIADYVELLRNAPDEAQNLFNDLLIGVTEFFRDRKEWEILETEVVPRLFEGKGPGDSLRVWVVGCSTGEEAYSLAMLLAEHRARREDPPTIQIFASDLDGRALAVGRAGRYPDRIAAELTPERLVRWFVKEGDTYCVVKELREMCIFSQHSLIKDAPFSRIDLISCRNLLIYLDAELQEKVIPLFHFALNPGGVLFLGNSENASRHHTLFAPIEPRSRIFRRLETATRVFPDFPFTSVERRWTARSTPPPIEREAPGVRDLTRWAEHVIERHTPAFVVIDEDFTVLHFSGPMGRYLAPASGAASLSLLQLIHPVLRVELRSALARAAEQNQTVELTGLEIGSNGMQLRVNLIIEPRLGQVGHRPGFVVIFKDCGVGEQAPRVYDEGDGRDEHIRRIEEDLRLTRERLQTTIEELESTNEELKSSNEEYQSLNEELQSANEELETSKEELQSVNEELTTVNGELAHRVQELARANSDLKNFLESTQIATLFLDNELRVANFTPSIVDVFRLVESDEGRPISHIKARVAYDELQNDARRVLRTLSPVEREIDNPETRARYIARVLPYRSTDNFIAGVVVTFVDVTARRNAEESLRRSEERFRAIVETARDYAIFTTDTAGRIETWPVGAEEIFGWTAAEAIGQPVDITFTPEDREAGEPAREREVALREEQAPDVRWHLCKDGRRVFIDGMVRPLLASNETPRGFLKIGQDVTEQRATEAALRSSEARQALLLWLSDALRPLTDPVAIQGEAARILAEHLDVDRAYYAEVDEAAGIARVTRDHAGNGPSLAGEYPVEAFCWSADVLRRGECHLIADTRVSSLVPPAGRQARAALGIVACMGAPLIKEGVLVGALCVTAASPRAWSPDEAATLREVAERIWAAIERVHAEARARETEVRLMAFGEASSDLLWIRDAETLAFEYVSPAFARIYGMDVQEVLQGDTLQNWLDMIVPEDRARAREAMGQLREGERLAFEYRITRPADRQLRLLRETCFPIHDPDGHVAWIAGVSHDATEERASGERLKVLVAELQHRTRNLLGVVRSVTEQTLTSSASLEDFRARIRDRLGALGRVNGLLSRLNEDDRIDFDELIRTELYAHGVLEDGEWGVQVRLHGPKGVRLRSSTVQTLALGLHELATNALKYGALSRPDGRLDVSWSLVDVPGEPPRLRVEWQEHGVPLPQPGAEGGGNDEAPPVRRGFGRELIEQALPYQLSAEVDYELGPDGVRCTITLPVSTSMDDAAAKVGDHG